MQDGAATGKVKALLEPFQDALLPGALTGYSLPVSDGSERNRRNLRKAIALMQQAGYEIQDGGVMQGADGTPFAFELLLRKGSSENEIIADTFIQSLARIGGFRPRCKYWIPQPIRNAPTPMILI